MTKYILPLCVPAFVFGMSMQDTVDLTLQNDPSLRSLGFQTKAKKADLGMAQSKLYPSIDADVSYTSRKYKLNDTKKNEEEEYNSYRLTLSQDIYNHTYYQAIKETRYDIQLQNTKLEAYKRELSLEVMTAYVDAAIAKEEIKLAKQKESFYTKKLQQLQKMYIRKLVTKNDLDEAKINKNEAYINTQQLSDNYEIALFKLKQYTNDYNFEIDEEIAQEDMIVVNALDVTNNLEYKMAQSTAKLSKQRINTAFSEHYPTLNVYANYTKYMSNDIINDYEDDKKVIVGVNIPLFRGWETSNKVAKNRYAYQASKEDIVAKEKELKNRYEEARFKSVILDKNIKLYTNIIVDSEKYLSDIESSFLNGLKNEIDFEEAKLKVAEKYNLLNKYKYEKIKVNNEIRYLTGALI